MQPDPNDWTWFLCTEVRLTDKHMRPQVQVRLEDDDGGGHHLLITVDTWQDCRYRVGAKYEVSIKPAAFA
jgi:hypothetical protein